MLRSRCTSAYGVVLTSLTATAAWAAQETTEPPAEIKIRLFDHFVVKGGAITWFILIPLSIAMVALIIEYSINIRRKKVLPPDLCQRLRDLFSQKKYREALDLTGTEASDLGFVINSALSQAASGYVAMERAAEEAIDARTARLLRKVELLNTVGNISPMIGLFGTIVGMIVAFQTLVESGGQPDPAKLAGGISVALVTTFWGLIIAIPALTAVSIFRNRIDSLAAECSLIADELLAVFRPATTRPAAAPAQPAPAAPRPAPIVQPTQTQ